MSETRTIWKYVLDGDSPVLEMPNGAQVVSFALQHDTPCLWAIVDPDAPRVGRRFRVVGTGWRFEWPMLLSVTYRGMVQAPNGLVWHLLEYGS
jgi:hypothetical protein